MMYDRLETQVAIDISDDNAQLYHDKSAELEAKCRMQ
jgi:hypothetical protein